jgi:hypothetical protein
MRGVVPRPEVLLLTGKVSTLKQADIRLKQADIRHMLKKASKNVLTSTIVVSSNHLSPIPSIYQLLQLPC